MHGDPVDPGFRFPPYSKLRNYELRPVAKGAS
jgi:hypothetical protein